MDVRLANDFQPADTSLRELAGLGQLRGSLTIDDIREALPIDRMSEEGVARAVAYLEDKGIEVILDPSLLTGPRSSRLEQRLVRTTSADAPKITSATTELGGRLARTGQAQQPAPGEIDGSLTATACVVAAAIFAGILAVILFWTVS